MKRRTLLQWSAFSMASIWTKLGSATTFLTLAQAQAALLPGRTMQPVSISLTAAQRKEIQARSGVRVRQTELNAWRSKGNEWFLVDQVLGKHEFIDLAVAIAADGQLLGLEILTYRESYGEQVRSPKWRAQFIGSRADSRLQLDDPIQNISGATLSCRHVTEGAKRLLVTWDVALRVSTP